MCEQRLFVQTLTMMLYEGVGDYAIDFVSQTLP